MQVPMLNFAQMPVMQLPNAMGDFSNALLQAGQMRQNRLQQAEQLARQQQQQQFENQMATQRMGLAEREFESAEKSRALTNQASQLQIDKMMGDEAFNAFLQENSSWYSEMAKADPIAAKQKLYDTYIAQPGAQADIARTLESELNQAKQTQAAQAQQKFQNEMAEKTFGLKEQELDLRRQQINATAANTAAAQQANMAKLLGEGFKQDADVNKDNYANAEQQFTYARNQVDQLDQDLAKIDAALANNDVATLNSLGAKFNIMIPEGGVKGPEYYKTLKTKITTLRDQKLGVMTKHQGQMYNFANAYTKSMNSYNRLYGMPSAAPMVSPAGAPSMMELTKNDPLGLGNTLDKVNLGMNQFRHILKQMGLLEQFNVIDAAQQRAKDKAKEGNKNKPGSLKLSYGGSNTLPRGFGFGTGAE